MTLAFRTRRSKEATSGRRRLAGSLSCIALTIGLILTTSSGSGRAANVGHPSPHQTSTGFVWVAENGAAPFWRISVAGGTVQRIAPPGAPKSLRSKVRDSSQALTRSEDGSVWATCCDLFEPAQRGHPEMIKKAVYYSIAYSAITRRWHTGRLCSLHRRTPNTRQWCPLDGPLALSADGREGVVQVFSDSWRIANKLNNLVLDPQTYGYNSPYLGIFDTFSGKLLHRLRLACKPQDGAAASWSSDGGLLGYACLGGPSVGIYLVNTKTWTTQKIRNSEGLFDSRYDSNTSSLNWAPGSASAIVEADLCQNSATQDLINQLQADGLNDYGSESALENALAHGCRGISVSVDLTSGEAAPVTPIGPNAVYARPVYGASNEDLFGMVYPCSGGDCDAAVVRFTPTAPGAKIVELTKRRFPAAEGSSVLYWAGQ